MVPAEPLPHAKNCMPIDALISDLIFCDLVALGQALKLDKSTKAAI